MKTDIQDRWTTALRSGKYSQARGKLIRDGGFCCLGVLCDLHSIETGTPWIGTAYRLNNSSLPPEVMEWAGLKPNDPNVHVMYRQGDYQGLEETTLTTLNDDNELNFDQIANIIEEEL